MSDSDNDGKTGNSNEDKTFDDTFLLRMTKEEKAEVSNLADDLGIRSATVWRRAMRNFFAANGKNRPDLFQDGGQGNRTRGENRRGKEGRLTQSEKAQPVFL